MSSRQLRFLFGLGITGAVALPVFKLALTLYGRTVVDDGYMFIRYADNLIANHVLAWNPQDGPAYGLTSPFFLLVVVPVRALLPNAAPLAALISSLISGIAFFALLARLVLPRGSARGPAARTTILLLAVTLAASSGLLVMHVVSGMDTMFALAGLTGYMLCGRNFETHPSLTTALFTGALGGLAYFARPDLLVYSFAVPGFLLFASLYRRDAAFIRWSAVIAGTTLVVVGLNLLLAWIFLGSALPLPFYAKATNLYLGTMAETFRAEGIEMGLTFFRTYSFLLAPSVMRAVIDPHQWWKRYSAVETGLVVGAATLIVYYTFFVSQIMGFGARFYFPVLPVLVYLACRDLAFLVDAFADGRNVPDAMPLRSVVAGGVLILVVLGSFLSLGPVLFELARHIKHRDSLSHLTQLKTAFLKEGEGRIWFALDEFSLLPNDLTIATTEVGLPGVMNPHKRIVDLAGLNEPQIAQQGFDADFVFRTYSPDLIYMPYPWYDHLLAQITVHKVFQEGYEVISRKDSGANMDVALRRASRHYPAMREIAVAALERHQSLPAR
jgi:hypothetical protein